MMAPSMDQVVRDLKNSTWIMLESFLSSVCNDYEIVEVSDGCLRPPNSKTRVNSVGVTGAPAGLEFIQIKVLPGLTSFHSDTNLLSSCGWQLKFLLPSPNPPTRHLARPRSRLVYIRRKKTWKE
ncbi:hypothetical protein Tco_1339151, partial [Tanacetum coccineum]